MSLESALARRLLRNLMGTLGGAASEPLPENMVSIVKRFSRADLPQRHYIANDPTLGLRTSVSVTPHGSISWSAGPANETEDAWRAFQAMRNRSTTRGMPSRPAQRLGLVAARAVRQAILNDVQNFMPPRLGWSATSLSRARLYDSMIGQLAQRYGYMPTFKTRLNQIMRPLVRRYPILDGLPVLTDYLGHDEYKRHGFMRSALEDALVAGAPTGLLAYAASQDEEQP